MNQITEDNDLNAVNRVTISCKTVKMKLADNNVGMNRENNTANKILMK